MKRHILDRSRPTVQPAAATTNSPGRRLRLYTGRGDVRLSAAEAVALGLDLFAAAAGLDPAAAHTHPLILGLAERCHAQSELLAACANRRK